MLRKLLFLFICFFYFPCIFAKINSGECPPWVKGDFPKKNNNTYYFKVEEGSGNTLANAVNDADLLLVSSLMRAAGVSVSGSQIEKQLYKFNNGQTDEQLISEYNYNFELGSVHMAFKAVDRYWEKNNNGYTCKVLYEVAYNPSDVRYDPVEYSSKYGARGLWRSAIIPGWGQMYKKSYAKGVAILTVEAAAITTAIIFDNRYSSYIRKGHSTTNSNAIKFYNDKANQAKNIRNGFIAGAAAVYVYNIVDDIVAKGKLRYINPKGKNLSIAPYVDTNNCAGFSLAFNF